MHKSPVDIPRVMTAALRGGSGKTLISIGIIAALSGQQKTVAPFKKGPDYIDAGWLATAAGRPCYNLDHFLASSAEVCRSFVAHADPSEVDFALIEGNRGLYDGLDIEGSTSTASLAKLLGTPVILCLDCTKATRTMAAVVLGCLNFEPSVRIAAVILNRVAGGRHERILRTSIETHCNVKVIGAIPKLDQEEFPERHMGLVPTPEHPLVGRAVRTAAETVARHVDLDRLQEIAQNAGPMPEAPLAVHQEGTLRVVPAAGPRIGVVRDCAFQFYYPDNLEALEAAGAELVPVSPLTDRVLPELDALYIGGGFPETHAAALAGNLEFRNALKSAAGEGLPVYAECGGLMYLGESLVLDQAYPMAGVLPIVFGFAKNPQGHGYTRLTVEGKNSYYPTGTELRGHEFHYSKVLDWRGRDADLVFTMHKGRGIAAGRDGITYRNVLATYTHVHCLGTPQWARALVAIARQHRGATA